MQEGRENDVCEPSVNRLPRFVSCIADTKAARGDDRTGLHPQRTRDAAPVQDHVSRSLRDGRHPRETRGRSSTSRIHFGQLPMRRRESPVETTAVKERLQCQSSHLPSAMRGGSSNRNCNLAFDSNGMCLGLGDGRASSRKNKARVRFAEGS